MVLAIVALAAYWNAWPNTLVLDDRNFAGSERFAELSNIPRYFTEDAWASRGVASGFYRPLLMTSVTLDARLFGEWVAGYHLTNIVLHALTSLCVFVFIRLLLQRTGGEPRTNTLCALLAALIFAVHPVHAEVVNSIFNRSEMLVALGGMAGLSWLLYFLDRKPIAAWSGLAIAYLVILFCKESAVVLPALAFVIVFSTTPANWKMRLRASLPVLVLLLPLAIYLALRFHALAPDGQLAEPGLGAILGTPSSSSAHSALQDDLWLRRLMKFAGLGLEAMKVLAWPHPLSTAYGPISRFEEYLGLALHLVLLSLAVILATRNRWALAAGLVFFYVALLPAAQIDVDPNASAVMRERFLYWPSIGLFSLLGFALRYARGRVDALMLASIATALMIVLTPLTWARNAEWRSDVRLFESDYENGNYDPQLLRWLSAAHNRESNFERVAALCDRHADLREIAGHFSNNCAVAYGQLGRIGDQETAYLAATRNRSVRAMAHANLARLYLAQGRWDDAREHFQRAVEAESTAASQAFRTGHMLVRLYPDDRQRLAEAKAWFERSLELQADYAPARQWLEQVERRLQAP